ncbi:MAG: DUF2029 domain-containing protein [Flavobacteriales bacterium]|nr:DUF2029 domain-containing protein [Flavobacteriales bacterium]
MSSLNRRSILRWLLLVAVLVFTITVAHRKGNDINVYLHAADQLWNSVDPYISNPYNQYLYGPFFALLLKPLTLLGYPIARVVWALLCMAALYRSWDIFRKEVLVPAAFSEKLISRMGLVLLLLSVNVYIHNLNLGQVTLPMLWCIIEGMYQIRKSRPWLGSAILAFGINLKILPLLVLFYYFLNRRWKPIILTMGILVLLLLIPALFIGWEANLAFHGHWLQMINPVGKKFGVEINDGCVSINCLMSRLPLSLDAMKWSTLVLRLIVVAVMTIYFFRRRNMARTSVQYWKDISMLFLVILLVFPHQMKYSMLFILPTGAYLLYRFYQQGSRWKGIYYLSAFCLVVPAIMGRDIIGNSATDFLDTIGILGIINALLFALLISEKEKAPSEVR